MNKKEEQKLCPCCGQKIRDDFKAEIKRIQIKESVGSMITNLIDYELQFLINFIRKEANNDLVNIEALKLCNRFFLADQLNKYNFETGVGHSVAGIVVSKLKNISY